MDLDIVQISELFHLNQNTINQYPKIMRTMIVEFCEVGFPFNGDV